MTEFERNYFGKRDVTCSVSGPSTRGSLARNNSLKEPSSAASIPSTTDVPGMTSLRRNLSFKKEVNFLSPTKQSPSPISANFSTLPHNFGQSNHNEASKSISILSSKSYANQKRYRAASVQDRERSHFEEKENQRVFDRFQQLGSDLKNIHNGSSRYLNQSAVLSNGNADYENLNPLKNDPVTYYSDSTCSDSLHYNPELLLLSQQQQSQVAHQITHFKNNHHSSSQSLSTIDQPKHKYRSDNQSHFGTIRIQPNARTTSVSHISASSSRTGSLKRSKGRSNQSLCSCDADTEGSINEVAASVFEADKRVQNVIDLSSTPKPLIQYGRDQTKDRKAQHTYSCEQNAQILLRIEKQRQMKKLNESSTGKLTRPGKRDQKGRGDSTDAATASSKQPEDIFKQEDQIQGTGCRDDADMIDHIPPPPQPPQLRRNLSLTHQHCTILASNQLSEQHNQKFGKHNLSSSPSISSSTSTTTQPLQPPTYQSHHHHHGFPKPMMVINGGFELFADDFSDDVSGYNSSPLQNYAADIRQSRPINSDKISGFAKMPQPPDVCNFTSTIGGQKNVLDSELSAKNAFGDSLCPNYDKLLCSAGHQLLPNCYLGINSDANNNPCSHQKWTTKDTTTSFSDHHPKTNNNNKLNQINNQSAPQSLLLYHQESPEFLPNYDCSNKLANGNLLDCRYFEPQLCKQNLFLFTPHTELLVDHLATDLCATNNRFDLPETADSCPGTLTKYQRGIGGGGGGGVAMTPSSSTSTMPWRHRTCSSSRGSSSSGNSSTRWDIPSRHWLALTSILLIAGAAGVAVPLALRVTASAPLEERLGAASQLLDAVPLIDGHNDLPWNIRKFLHNQLNDFDFDTDLRNVMPWAKSTWSHTDLSRLRKGRVSAQFWAAYVPCEAQHRDAVQLTLEQIDVIKRLTERYSPELTSCASVDDVMEAHKNHQLCSLTGVEGGHSLGGSLGVLRTFYTVGVRYLTLTSTCHTPWADSSNADAPKYDVKHGGLTGFGKTIIREMNRLGMIVDLSHTSIGTMKDALEVSDAPVIFSHSSAFHLCNSSRNVQDDILEAVARNRGLVMVNFYSRFLSCSENATVQDAVAHINHIKRIAGIDHVGLGAGFDGINFTPKGLEDVSTYPMLFAELLGDGWTVEELTKLAGQNFLRVMSEVETIRDKKKKAGIRPYEDIPNFRSEDPYNCTSS